MISGNGLRNSCAALAVTCAIAGVISSPHKALAQGNAEPRHGGTLTFIGERAQEEPPGWDIPEAASATVMYYTNPYAEHLIGADVIGRGPRGSNDYSFALAQAEVPEAWLTGTLAEKWELTTEPLGVKFHIRKGVMWTGNPNIGMEPREVTADDIVFVLDRYREGKQASKTSDFIDKGAFKALDSHTVQITFKRFSASWAWIIGYALYSEMYAPEVVKAGPMDWKNAVGTGPFILNEYVPASYVSYRKNPDWWNKSQAIAGKNYTVPFIDELVLPIMANEAARIAAIRTGQADIESAIKMHYKDTLSSTNPDLHVNTTPQGRSFYYIFNSISGAAAEHKFRRAVMLATDEQAIVDAVIPGGSVGGEPFSKSLGPDLFTPLDQLPPESAALFGYDPEAAKKLLEEIGMSGAEFPIHYSASDSVSVQAAALMADQLSKAGIKAVLDPIEAAVLSKYQTGDGKDWQGAVLWWGGNSKTARGADVVRALPFASLHNDPDFNAKMDEALAMVDDEVRNAKLKELGVYMIGRVDRGAIGESTVLTAWWPWVKNYYGELEAGYNNYNPMFSTLWIDEDMKKQMGY